jgi:DNA-binding transcriptional ArsR family regulator
MEIGGAGDAGIIAERFGALAHPHRVEILRLLLAAYQVGGLTAGHLQARLKIPGSTLNHHLSKLERAGLVSVRKDRQYVWYSARSEGLRQLLDFLFQECCTQRPVIPVNDLFGGKQA